MRCLLVTTGVRSRPTHQSDIVSIEQYLVELGDAFSLSCNLTVRMAVNTIFEAIRSKLGHGLGCEERAAVGVLRTIPSRPPAPC